MPTIPVIDIPGFGMFGSHNIGGQKHKKVKLKSKKPNYQYTAGLIAAAFGGKPVKVSTQQYKQLSQRTYATTAGNPVLELVPDNKAVARMIRKVNF
jgi:hypothetical protein